MKYKIGDTVYLAYVGNKLNTILCPVCFGKKEVTVILGNGDPVSTPCDYCGKGYSSPTGYVEEYTYTCTGVPFHITGADIIISNDGERVEYRSGTNSMYQTAKEEYCYPTIEEATKAAVAFKDKREKEDVLRRNYGKQNHLKSYSWNVGYHMKQIKRLQNDIAYHQRMVTVCEAKAKK